MDISCVTKWTKLDTKWKGVSVDTLIEHVEVDPKALFVIAFAEQGYTTNFPLPDLIDGRAFVAYEYADKPLAPEHGGPARLVEKDQPGFWESAGYNNHGDPWREERYS